LPTIFDGPVEQAVGLQRLSVSEIRDQIRAFVEYCSRLEGDERGEAQVFCDRLFKAFGHYGYKEAGAILEFRVKRQGQATAFADLVWRPRLLIEMKSRGQKLQKHYQQAFEYWLNAVPDRPRYVVLCNFDEFWIYDFNVQLHEPMDRVRLDQLVDRYEALNFLFPDEKKPSSTTIGSLLHVRQPIRSPRYSTPSEARGEAG